jgi:hypothetical protein
VAEDKTAELSHDDLVTLLLASAIVRRLAEHRMDDRREHVHLAHRLREEGTFRALIFAAAVEL